MHRRHFTQRTLALAASAWAGAARAQAQATNWPDRPVKWVLSQPPGSGQDNVARLLSDRLAKLWGQALIIENKPGGQNSIGAQAAVRAAPDGSTFYFATTAALVTNTDIGDVGRQFHDDRHARVLLAPARHHLDVFGHLAYG